MLRVLRSALLLLGLSSSLAGPAMSAEEFSVTYEPSSPAKGKHIVLVSGDEEYRSEQVLPALAKILATHHGFRCTVLFAIDPADGTINPNYVKNIPGWRLSTAPTS